MNKDYTGNYIQYLVMTYNGKEYETVYIYIYIYVCICESFCFSHETNTTLQINYSSIKNEK